MERGAVEQVAVQLAWMLVGAALLGMVARWVRVPYAVLLVVAGIGVAASGSVVAPRLEPSVLLFILLPPLLFDASFRLDATELRRLLVPVLWLSVPGVFITAAVVGAALWLAAGLPLATALLFGSIVAATDPVAVVSVFGRLGAPHRLTIVAEAESLINDGMAITLYVVLLGFAVTGAVSPLEAGGLLLWEVVVGGGIGAGLGLLCSRLTTLIDDHLIEMTLSTALAYGAFLAAQSVHASGALACVAAGLVHGSYGREVGMSVATRRLLDDLWEYLGFVANAMVFLLLGFSAGLPALLADLGPIAIAFGATLVARLLIVEGGARSLPLSRRSLSGRERVVLTWAGLRGALSVALALALPEELPNRALIVSTAFGVVLLTLLIQGLTLAPLLGRLGLAHPEAARDA